MSHRLPRSHGMHFHKLSAQTDPRGPNSTTFLHFFQDFVALGTYIFECVFVFALTRDQGPGTGNQGPGTRDRGPGTRDQGPGTRDQGPGQGTGTGTGTRDQDQGPGTRDGRTDRRTVGLSDGRMVGWTVGRSDKVFETYFDTTCLFCAPWTCPGPCRY